MKPVIGIPVSAAKKLNEAAHTFAWVTDQEATATEAGAKHEECTVCGYAKTAIEILQQERRQIPIQTPRRPEIAAASSFGFRLCWLRALP